ncbi:hypothetical protein J0692_04855 [Vibrio alginolyticus]|uniref:hypothetical protein n=1 Tax=Vibrio alginolyticus TaxID=663 RepID=UPI001A8DB63A|nr:hypothetical protein [Vibrio alginolyticus]MBO0161557.1 hypothetical protein [Vibrio alginolyticus]
MSLKATAAALYLLMRELESIDFQSNDGRNYALGLLSNYLKTIPLHTLEEIDFRSKAMLPFIKSPHSRYDDVMFDIFSSTVYFEQLAKSELQNYQTKFDAKSDFSGLFFDKVIDYYM